MADLQNTQIYSLIVNTYHTFTTDSNTFANMMERKIESVREIGVRLGIEIEVSGRTLETLEITLII